MRNLNGTPTATEEGTLAFGSLPLWFIGGNVGASQAEASTKLLEQTGQVAKTGLTNPQLVQKSATLAERTIGRQGPVAGIAKHKYATNLLDRYQSIYGHKGLFSNHSFNNGVGNRV